MTGLPLRDVHLPPAPSWWPPAPGWWWVLGGLMVAVAAWQWLAWRRRKRRLAIARLFDDAVAQATSPSARVAAMSELLRRAARQIDANADKLQGDDWLQFLDAGLAQPVFSAGAGRLLQDGGFRADVSDSEADALLVCARERFIDWLSPGSSSIGSKRRRLPAARATPREREGGA